MILFCACAYSDVIPVSRRRAALARLRASNGDVRVVSDLCGLAACGDPIFQEAAAAGELCIAACHPRAVGALFAWAGAPLDPAQVRFVNLREAGQDDRVEQISGAEEPSGALPAVDRGADWIPWFPVIDPARCISCRQCLEFCLFGVYEMGQDGAVRVAHPEGCKTNCPACARLCPETAIMFPKYGDAPINGAEITDETAARAAAKAVAEGDLRSMLEERRKRRIALLKPEYRPDGAKPQS